MNHRRILFAMACAIVGIAWTVGAAPILRSGRKLTEKQRSITGIELVRLEVAKIQGELKVLGISTKEIEDVFNEEITASGLHVLEDPSLPMVRLVIFSSDNPDLPDTLVITFVIAFHQDIIVKRLEQDMWAPTAFFTQTKLTTRAQAPHLIKGELRKITAKVVRILNKASSQE